MKYDEVEILGFTLFLEYNDEEIPVSTLLLEYNGVCKC